MVEIDATALSSLPDGTKILLGLLVTCYALHATMGLSFLLHIPLSTNGGAVWNLVTFALVEPGIVQLALSVLVVAGVGRVAEPLWGTGEFVKYILIVNLCAGVILWLQAVIVFQGSGLVRTLRVEQSGFQAGVGALLVAAKQLCGEQELPGKQLRTKHLASIYFVLCCVTMLFIDATFGGLGMIGTWFGWVYLRFYQSSGGRTGDNANSFAFVTFFPELIQDTVAIPATIVHNIAAMCKLINKVEPPSEDDDDSFYAQQASSLGTNTAVAERRRLKAQKELEARLAAAGNDDELVAFEDLADDSNDIEAPMEAVAEAVLDAIVGDAPKES